MDERKNRGRPDTTSLVLIANLAATAVMVGVIWYVQIVHYPLMAGWPHEDFGVWEARHRERTALVVIPTMLLEGVTAAALLGSRQAGAPLDALGGCLSARPGLGEHLRPAGALPRPALDGLG